MGKQAITYEQVVLAAEKLKKKGKVPSLTNLSEQLGILSIDANLSAFLERWYHTQPEFHRTIIDPASQHLHVETNPILERNLELEKSLSLLRATLESTADGIMMVNGKGQIVDWNQKFVEMWRIPAHLMEAGPENLSFEYILDQLINPASLISDVQYLYSHPDWQGVLPELHFKDGRIFERFTQPQRIGEELVGRVYSFRDVTQRRIADDELRIRERAIEASSHGIAIIDIAKPTQPIVYINKAFERITGFSEKIIIGQKIDHLLGGKIEQVNYKRIALAFRELREETVELESYRSNGETFWCSMSVAPVSDSFNQVKHFVCIINDITQRREMENQLLQQATHDSLTQLPNRVLLIDRVDQGILQCKKNGGMLAFMFLDLDRFKLTNDTLGHTLGDKLLQAVSNRLLIATHDLDTVARLGGDEFVVFMEIQSEQQALDRAQELVKIIAKPFQVEQHSLQITVSIGISFYPRDGTNYETLMKNADLSMYHAKDNGRNVFRVFDQEMNRRVINHMQMDSALREAMQHNEFYLVYQPLVDLRKNTITGFEALIRWNSHMLGAVAPVDFIGLAEGNGLIIDIGQWVLEEACMQLARWHKEGYTAWTMAVNISGVQFKQTHLVDKIAQTLRKTGVAGKYLELELTESLLVDNIDKAVETMYQLKDMGIKLVIDDFGTGYSSLSYLKRLPVDKLKIDRSFISELVQKENDAAITRAIITLGHSLNLDVLAEGIETEAQKNFLIAHGCDYAQGYYFKPPHTVDALKDFLKANTPLLLPVASSESTTVVLERRGEVKKKRRKTD